MKLTKLEQQGLRLTMCLARKGGQMTLPELAELEGLSEALVAKVLGRLRKGGVVSAARGRNGGYVLRSPGERTAVGEVLRALGRPIIEGCFTEDPARAGMTCRHSADCALRPVWEYLDERVTEVLDDVTLADLITSEKHVKARMDEMRGDGGAGGKAPPKARSHRSASCRDR